MDRLDGCSASFINSSLTNCIDTMSDLGICVMKAAAEKVEFVKNEVAWKYLGNEIIENLHRIACEATPIICSIVSIVAMIAISCQEKQTLRTVGYTALLGIISLTSMVTKLDC